MPTTTEPAVKSQLDCNRPATNTASYGLRCFDGSPVPMDHSHRHNDVEINLILGGEVVYHFGSSNITLSSGTFGLFWAAMPHQLIHGTSDASMFWVTLPLPLFLKWKLPGSISRRVLEGQLLMSAESATDDVSFRRWADDLAGTDPELTRIMQLELEARLRRFGWALDAATPPNTAVPFVGPAVVAGSEKAQRMSAYIAEHFNEPLRVEQVARSVHIHPTYAMHLFRETYGISIIDYLTQHRIAHAQQLLATTDMSVMDISLECGFNSVSRFYAAFNSICGKSPRAYRETLRSFA
jgi:AraC family transcriptional regulator, melibiose operon regulatory protein